MTDPLFELMFYSISLRESLPGMYPSEVKHSIWSYISFSGLGTYLPSSRSFNRVLVDSFLSFLLSFIRVTIHCKARMPL